MAKKKTEQVKVNGVVKVKAIDNPACGLSTILNLCERVSALESVVFDGIPVAKAVEIAVDGATKPIEPSNA